MKKSCILFSSCLLFLVFQTGAQTDKTGTVVENREDELLQSDPLNGKQHFKAIPFTMKKGQAVLFTMKSSAFIPHILFGTNQALIAIGQTNESRTESKVTFLAPADTSFYVFFTSMEENKTGKFSYGYNLLDADQVNSINNAKSNSFNRFTPGNLGKQLLEILDHSKDGFKTIRGEKIKTVKKKDEELYAEKGELIATKIREVISIINYYETSYSLPNAKENSIIETIPNEKKPENSEIKFESVYGMELTKAEGEDLYNRLSKYIKLDLATGFEITESMDGDDSNGRYYGKFLRIAQVNNKKHRIYLTIVFNPGVGGIFPENAIVTITCE